MNPKMPCTPFSTRLSGSARLAELRIRNIFAGPKKRPPAIFIALVSAFCLLCGNLVSCQVAEAETDPPDASQPEEVSQPEAPKALPASELTFDINQNGIPEELRLVKHDYNYGVDWNVEFWENGERFLWKSPGICLYTQDGKDYLLYYTLDEHQGFFNYDYRVADLSGEFEETSVWNSVHFDTNFKALFHKGLDPEKIAVFMDELNGLLSHSIRLTNADGELAAEKCQPEDLPWLDAYPEIFTRDPDKSLEENLRDFQSAMTAAYPAPEPMGEVDTLPFDQPLEMIFLSGAGAWCTGLDLNPDGTFTADYHDADGAILYVCQFHGKLGSFVQLTEHSWSLTLEELVLDTKYPVGKEWDEDGFHKISSGPNGFTDQDGNALQPGARFILYSPQAQGYAPGTELYGAYDFWTWWPGRHDWGPDDTLGCWGLYNLTQEIGFFSYD